MVRSGLRLPTNLHSARNYYRHFLFFAALIFPLTVFGQTISLTRPLGQYTDAPFSEKKQISGKDAIVLFDAAVYTLYVETGSENLGEVSPYLLTKSDAVAVLESVPQINFVTGPDTFAELIGKSAQIPQLSSSLKVFDEGLEKLPAKNHVKALTSKSRTFIRLMNLASLIQKANEKDEIWASALREYKRVLVQKITGIDFKLKEASLFGPDTSNGFSALLLVSLLEGKNQEEIKFISDVLTLAGPALKLDVEGINYFRTGLRFLRQKVFMPSAKWSFWIFLASYAIEIGAYYAGVEGMPMHVLFYLHNNARHVLTLGVGAYLGTVSVYPVSALVDKFVQLVMRISPQFRSKTNILSEELKRQTCAESI